MEYVCNTYYQLIMAIDMRLTLFKNDKVTLLLSDHSSNADKISERLIELHVFDKVGYVKTKSIDYCSESKIDKFMDYLKIIFNNNILQILTNEKFDKLFYFNQNLSSNLIFNSVVKNNSYIEVCQFEEGILSYPNIGNNKLKNLRFGRTKLLCVLRKIFLESNIIEKLEKFIAYILNYTMEIF